MNERDFEIGNRVFRLSKIDTFKQFHIVRRLGPILGELIPAAQKLIKATDKKDQTEQEKLEAIGHLITPIMNGLSKLSDADSDFVLIGLLSSVEVQQMPAKNWARIAINGNLMIEDLELPTMLQVAGKAIGYNLASFFAIAPQISHGGR